MAANHVRPSRPSSTGPAHSSTKPLSDRWIRPAWRNGAWSAVPAPSPSLSSSASEGGSEGHGGTNAVTKPRRLGHLCPPHDPVRYVLCGRRSHYLATKP